LCLFSTKLLSSSRQSLGYHLERDEGYIDFKPWRDGDY
jgi:hypothetical protein